MQIQAVFGTTVARNHSPIHPAPKALLVRAACRKMLPVNPARRIVQRLPVVAA